MVIFGLDLHGVAAGVQAKSDAEHLLGCPFNGNVDAKLSTNYSICSFTVLVCWSHLYLLFVGVHPW